MTKQTSKYKQTEIGEIPRDWDIKSLSELAEIISGGTPKTSITEYWNGDIPWLSVVDFNQDQKKVYGSEKHITKEGLQNSSTNILKKGMLIISARGTVGALAQLGIDMTFNQSCYGLNANGEIKTNDFLYYALKSKLDSVKQKTHGSVFSTITKETFNSIYLPIPLPDEQQQIASILSSLDDKIELNHRMNKTLEEMGKALFIDWLTNGDTNDGELQDIVAINPKESMSKGKTARYVEMKDLPEQGMWVYSDVSKPYKGGSKFRNGDTLIARITPCLENGKSGYVNSIDDDEVAFGSTEFIVMRPKDCLYEEFVYYMARDDKFRDFAIKSMVGSSGRQRVQTDAIVTYPFILPPADGIERFHTVMQPIFSQIKSNSLENATLSKVRDSLLPRLMSGKIRVEDYEN